MLEHTYFHVCEWSENPHIKICVAPARKTLSACGFSCWWYHGLGPQAKLISSVKPHSIAASNRSTDNKGNNLTAYILTVQHCDKMLGQLGIGKHVIQGLLKEILSIQHLISEKKESYAKRKHRTHWHIREADTQHKLLLDALSKLRFIKEIFSKYLRSFFEYPVSTTGESFLPKVCLPF